MKTIPILAIFVFVGLMTNQAHSASQKLTNANADQVLASNELVFINFYANWCRFSQMLEPIFDEFADKVAKELAQPGKLAIGKVDCDVETTFAQKNQISKYPTLKLYRYGVALKKEYRGARTVEGFMNYIKEQMDSPIKRFNTPQEFATLEVKKSSIIGYFENEQSQAFKTFTKLGNILRDSCQFVSAVGPNFALKRANGESVVFRNRGSPESMDVRFDGDINSYDLLYAWANDHCTPIVREITFENAEELTEEGLPFLILFHRPDDMNSVRLYEKEVVRQLPHLRNTITAVYADGNKFSHPLHHLGKSASDLPVLAIDSFRHMYLFSDYKKMTDGVSLKKFVEDLHSGKLHREFHNGPDPTEAPKQIAADGSQHLPKASNEQKQRKSTPPESVFVNLAPSENRYSIKHGDGGEL